MSKNNLKLNLPQTNFSMKANLVQKEPVLLKQWHKEQRYQYIREYCIGRKKFILHDGPPYANGRIHVGHAVNKILKDIIVRFKTISGYDVPYIPGWDCHGLPIELEIEKINKKFNLVDNESNFRLKCRKYATTQVNKQSLEFQRLGILGRWDNPYLTLNSSYESHIIKVLINIIKNNHLKRGLKPIHWCVHCESAISDAEIEYFNKKSNSIYVLFKIINVDFLSNKISMNINKDVFIIVWTTTPWTLLSNEAIAINVKYNYLLINFNNKLFLIVEDVLLSFIKNYNINNYTILYKFSGDILLSCLCEHPLLTNKIIKCIHSNHVVNTCGTGFVHISPSCGNDDFELGKKYNLPINNVTDSKGYINHINYELLNGKFYLDVNNLIIEKLKLYNKLLFCDFIEHSYPYCWRHKIPLIIRSTYQWFISMNNNNLLNNTLLYLDHINWIPQWGKNRMFNMLNNRPDWCISRQRLWNVPIPLFIHKVTQKLHPDTENILLDIANKISKFGMEYWFDNKNKININDKDQYDVVNDTLDVWFDSGCSSLYLLNQNNNLSYPADLYLEGSDQYRGWFQNSLLLSVATNKVPPFKTVLTHGFVLDSKGYKMSKSLKNIISPQDVINKYGADILRLWVASTDYKKDMIISDEILQNIVIIYRKIRNTLKFLLSNLYDFNYTDHNVSFDNMVDIDKWSISETLNFQKNIIKSYDNYDFHMVVQYIYSFCFNEMGSFYFDIIKDRLYTMNCSCISRRSAQSAIYKISHAVVSWISPILCFTADDFWNHLIIKKDNNLRLLEIEGWYSQLKFIHNYNIWSLMKKIKVEYNKLLELERNKKHIKSTLEVELKLYVNNDYYNILKLMHKELKFLFIVSKVDLYSLNKDIDYYKTDIAGINMIIIKSKGFKCIRCWHYVYDLNDNFICIRCSNNISLKKDNFESRKFF